MPKTPKSQPLKGRRPGQTSQAIATSARRNGVKGGAAGGRPKARLPDDSIARLGPPPTGPLELIRWHALMLAEVQWLTALGEIGPDIASSLRAGAGTAARLLPPDIAAALDAKIRDQDRDMKRETTGTPLEDVPPGQPDTAMRRNAR